MAATIKELFLGYSGSAKDRRIRYLVRDATDEDEAISLILATAPALRGGLVVVNASANEIGSGLFSGEALYGEATGVPNPPSASATYTFNMQVEPETFLYSRNRISSSPGSAPSVINGMIGVELDESQGRWSGITVPAGPVTDEISYEYPAAVIPNSYRATVRSLLGKVANHVFLGEPAGTMRFVACSASVSSDSTQRISFKFANRQNRTEKLGDINLGTVDGWDFVWSYNDIETFNDGNTVIAIPKPRFAYIERLLDRASFGPLGLPGV